MKMRGMGKYIVVVFFDQVPCLFILLLVLCSYYSRVAFIFLESLQISTTAG